MSTSTDAWLSAVGPSLERADRERMARLLAELRAAPVYVASLLASPRERRDAALRRLADLLAPGGTPNARARAVERRLNAYLSSRWQRERHLDQPPARADMIGRELFGIARANSGASLGWRRITDVLALAVDERQ